MSRNPEQQEGYKRGDMSARQYMHQGRDFPNTALTRLVDLGERRGHHAADSARLHAERGGGGRCVLGGCGVVSAGAGKQVLACKEAVRDILSG